MNVFAQIVLFDSYDYLKIRVSTKRSEAVLWLKPIIYYMRVCVFVFFLSLQSCNEVSV